LANPLRTLTACFVSKFKMINAPLTGFVYFLSENFTTKILSMIMVKNVKTAIVTFQFSTHPKIRPNINYFDFEDTKYKSGRDAQQF
jgi:hypothetical protein